MIDEASYKDYVFQNRWLRWLAGLMLIGLLVRMVHLQVVQGEAFLRFSQNNQLQKLRVPPVRGLIYDRHGRVLADYDFRYDVVLIPQYLREPDRVIAFLADNLNMSADEIMRVYTQRRRRQPRFWPVYVARGVSEFVMAAIEEKKKYFDGLDVLMTPTRYYPFGEQFSHVLGYVGEVTRAEIERSRPTAYPYAMGDVKGRRGLELMHDDLIRGKAGSVYVLVDAHGRRVERDPILETLLGRIKDVPATQGHHVVSTLDADVQKTLYDAFEGHTGGGVVMDIYSGRVLAMVSLPSYNTNAIHEQYAMLAVDEEKPLFNRAIQGVYPPGSAYKVIAALAGLMSGALDKDRTVRCMGSYFFGRRFHCWKKTGHGDVAMRRGIKESCDVYFYHLGRMVGVDYLAAVSKMLGLGVRTGIQLEYEQTGLVPTSAWKLRALNEPWMEGETLSVVIGQGFISSTPLQLALSIATILNGGYVYRPYLSEYVMDDAGKVVLHHTPRIVRHTPIPAEMTETIRDAMVAVMEEPGGTGYFRRSREIKIGGKTGTSQVRSFAADEIYQVCEELPYKDRHHALFVGFWPADDPRYVAAAVREHGCSGSRGALPIVRTALEALARRYSE